MKHRAPLIGVTTSVVDNYPERASINAAYLVAVQKAGGVPVLLPPQLDKEACDVLWDRLDGLLLTGGADVDPALFGEGRHETVYGVSPSRDSLEMDLVRRSLARPLPVLAICRGIQILNVTLGGTLYQDIPSQIRTALTHSQTERRDQPTHRVVIEQDTRLGRILQTAELAVNSFHHQSIKRLGGGLRAVAWAQDDADGDRVIEGIEMPGAPFVVGVQWHPEDVIDRDPAARRLFAALVAASGPGRRHDTTPG